MFAQVKEGKAKELKLVLKADVQGSLEAIKGAIAKVPHGRGRRSGASTTRVGDITESDLTLAAASGAVVIGFNTKMEAPRATRRRRRRKRRRPRNTRSSTSCSTTCRRRSTGMLEPEMVETVIGHAEVRPDLHAGQDDDRRLRASSTASSPRRAGAAAAWRRRAVYDGKIELAAPREGRRARGRRRSRVRHHARAPNDVQVGDVIEAYVVQPKPR